MDVDDMVDPPKQDIRMGGLETTPRETVFPYDGNNTDDGSDKGGDDRSGNEGPVMDSDSEDEFESDEEGVDVRGEREADQRVLDFELKAAEAGNVPCGFESVRGC